MRSIILAGLLVLLLSGVSFSRPCIDAWGNTKDGERVHVVYCLSYDQPSADKGVYKLEMRGGTFYKTEDGIFVSDSFGSNANGIGFRDTGTGFVVLSDHPGMFYIFYSEVANFEIIGRGTGYKAYIYVFEASGNGFNLIGWWHTIYMSIFDILANEWFWTELPQPIFFNYFEE